MPFDQNNEDHGDGGSAFITTIFKPGVVASGDNTTQTEICCTGHALELLALGLFNQAMPVLDKRTEQIVYVPLEMIDSIYIGGQIGKQVDEVLKEFMRVFAHKRN